MKYEELAFFNQQLATMLKEGIPLEGALRQLCATMHRGNLRTEFEKLQSDLTKGIPLQQALDARSLPTFYIRMVQVGVQGNDLPGVLLLLADYYQKVNSIWTRLKGLMVYPVIVLLMALGLSVFLTFFMGSLVKNVLGGRLPEETPFVILCLWAPAVLLAFLSLGIIVILAIPRLRSWFQWHLPAFRETSLAQFASTMALLLKGGCTLKDAIDLLQHLESKTPAGAELTQWQTQMVRGNAKFAEIARTGTIFPPLFIWQVSNAGEDLASGFQRAADIYFARGVYRTEMLLYAALPASIMVLGIVLLSQVYPVAHTLIMLVQTLGQY